MALPAGRTSLSCWPLPSQRSDREQEETAAKKPKTIMKELRAPQSDLLTLSTVGLTRKKRDKVLGEA